MLKGAYLQQEKKQQQQQTHTHTLSITAITVVQSVGSRCSIQRANFPSLLARRLIEVPLYYVPYGLCDNTLFIVLPLERPPARPV